jgi:hypothetical protein
MNANPLRCIDCEGGDPDVDAYRCPSCEEELAEGAPADCPGGGIDDLCTWPDVEACGLCTLGMNPELL